MSQRALTDRIKQIELPGYGADEVMFMAHWLERAQPTHVFEWGTNRGSSARIFWEAQSVLGLEYEIHTIELPLAEAFRDRDHPGVAVGFYVQDLAVHLHEGDGLRVSLELVEKLNPERPFFFVDGYHSYDQVWLELHALSALEAPILLHDSRHLTGVRDAIANFLERRADFEREDLESAAGMTALWPR